MLNSLTGNLLELLRLDFSRRFGRCDIIVMISDEDPMGLKPYAIPDQDNMIVLNISELATMNYVATETGISFQCRMRDVIMDIALDYSAIGGVRDPSFEGKYSETEWIAICVTEKDITDSMDPEDFEPEPTPEKPKRAFTVVK